MAEETRATVKTTVPKYQKDAWVEHAEDLDMSQAEFVRTMVQAGRREFELDAPEPGSQPATPGVDGLENRVLDVLAETRHATFDEIVAAVSENLESRVDEVLRDLDDAGQLEFNNLEGYSLAGGGRGDA